MPALAGNVADRRILDADCGSGPLMAARRDRIDRWSAAGIWLDRWVLA